MLYSGHVQGVGFRYTARSIAAELPVVGLVRNLPDGRVQLIAEGSAAAIDVLLARVEAELGRPSAAKRSPSARRPASFRRLTLSAR